MAVMLRKLNQNDEQAFRDGMQEWVGESPHWYSFIWKPEMSFSEMLGILEKESAGIDLEPGRVPHTMLYGFLDGKIIGRVSIRHTLNDRLRMRGGHIGYTVAKKYRRQGLATEMVGQAIEFCKGLGLTAIMISCSEENVPSWKIIEHFGGNLEDKVWDAQDNEMIRRYWIEF